MKYQVNKKVKRNDKRSFLPSSSNEEQNCVVFLWLSIKLTLKSTQSLIQLSVVRRYEQRQSHIYLKKLYNLQSLNDMEKNPPIHFYIITRKKNSAHKTPSIIWFVIFLCRNNFFSGDMKMMMIEIIPSELRWQEEFLTLFSVGRNKIVIRDNFVINTNNNSNKQTVIIAK